MKTVVSVETGEGASVPRAAAAVGRPPGVRTWEAGSLVAICGVALALRLANLQQLHAHDPFFELPSVDARLYHEWAQRIAAGDWLGEEAFLNGPLYPYALAGIYALFGPSLLAAKCAQALLGTLSCLLTWALGRRLFGPGVGLGAAGLVAVSQMLIFYEGTLVVANVLVALGVAAVLAVVLALERPSARGWFGAGVAVGLAALARPNMLLLGALCAAWLPVSLSDRPWRLRLRWLAAFAGGTLVLVTPVTVRNYVVADDFVLLTYSGGLNLYLGNNPDADGSFRVPRIFPRSAADDPWEQKAVYRSAAERLAGRPLRPSEISRVWSAEALRFAREAPGPWLRLMCRKLELAFNSFEPWNIRSITVTKEFSWVLRLPLVTFGVLSPLALLGIWLSAARWRELVPLYALLLAVFGSLLIFFVLSRYRVPAIPVLAVFASAGAMETTRRAASAGRRSGLALPLLACALFAIAGHRTVATEDLSVAYYNLGNRYKALANWPLAIESYERCLQARPSYLSAHNNLALVYEASGDHEDEARRAWERVRTLGEAQGLARYVERAERHLRALGAATGATVDPRPARP